MQNDINYILARRKAKTLVRFIVSFFLVSSLLLQAATWFIADSVENSFDSISDKLKDISNKQKAASIPKDVETANVQAVINKVKASVPKSAATIQLNTEPFGQIVNPVVSISGTDYIRTSTISDMEAEGLRMEAALLASHVKGRIVFSGSFNDYTGRTIGMMVGNKIDMSPLGTLRYIDGAVEVSDKDGNLIAGIYQTGPTNFFYQGYFRSGSSIKINGLKAWRIIDTNISHDDFLNNLGQCDVRHLLGRPPPITTDQNTTSKHLATRN